MSPDRAGELVQPILVAKTGTHAATIALAAQASLSVYLRDLKSGPVGPQWNTWLAGRFTKSARRADQKLLLKAIEHASAAGLDHSRLDDGDSCAVAFPPMTYAEYPRPIAKAQVAGTDLPRETDIFGGGPVTIAVLETLTTGKAAAQAAHAVWIYALSAIAGRPEQVTDWLDEGLPLRVELVSADQLAALASVPGAHRVVDAGLTEIDPGTVTAAAYVR